MAPSLHSTHYSFSDGTPGYAVRRVSDGFYLCTDGEYRPMSLNGKRNDGRIDYRVDVNFWFERNIDITGCEIVAISEVTLITAVPINW